MVRRLPHPLACSTLIASAFAVGGCSLPTRLGSLPEGEPADAAVEATTGARDAGAFDGDATPTRFEQPGGTVEEFQALRTLLSTDRWWGATNYSEQRPEVYEVTFSPDGTYRTRCLEEGCQPFGLGTAGDHGHRWDLITLDSEGYGQGELTTRLWFGTYSMTMQEVSYREQDETLTFVLFNVPVATGQDSRALTIAPVVGVALVRADAFAGPVEAVRDAGVSDVGNDPALDAAARSQP